MASGPGSFRRIDEEPIWVFGIPKDSQLKLGYFQLSYDFFKDTTKFRVGAVSTSLTFFMVMFLLKKVLLHLMDD